MKELIELHSVADITEPSRGSAESISSCVCFGKIDPLLPRLILLSVLVNQQLAFECGNLRVNHAKAVQLTAASEGDVL